MKITRLAAIGLFAMTLGASAVQAQNSDRTPAEFPPAGYKGLQYVDSRGCVFIRAGIDGNVTWVPRVSRARKTVCGFQPSLSGQAAAAAQGQAPRVEAPVQITLNDTVTPVAKPAPAPKPAPRKVAAPRPAPAPVVRQTAPKPTPRVVRQPAAVVPAPVLVARQIPAPAPTPVLRGAAGTTCPGLSALGQQYVRGGGGMAVRCGPQAASATGGARVVRTAPAPAPQYANTAVTRLPAPAPQYTYNTARPAAVAPTTVDAHTRIVPKHVAYNRINTTNVAVPDGYRRVWEDGRLNPNRAEQSLAGRGQMLLIWTQTVPRRLIDQRTGRDMTATVPLVYPYLNIAQQQRELGEVSIVQRNGQVTKRIVRNANAAPATRKPVYSSRSTPRAAQPAPAPARAAAAVGGKQFVQVGTFANAANAQRTAQKVANMGMPARIGQVRSKGKTLLIVQAGPFNGASAMQSAMSQLRGAGFRDAFARN